MPRTRSPPAGTSAADMIAVLGELVAKSLVTVEFHGASARYRLTESTRAYALEKLHNEGEFERIAARHARYEREHGTRRRARTPRGATMGRRSTERRISVCGHRSTERRNSRCGHGSAERRTSRSINRRARADQRPCPKRTAWRARCWSRHGCTNARRGRDAFDTAAADPVDAAREMRLRAACASALLHTDGDAVAAAAMWDRTLGLAAQVGDDTFDARALVGQWHTMLTLSDIHESLRYATRFERAAERRGDRSQRLPNAMVATSLHYFGEHAQARERLEAATAELVAVGEPPCAQAALGVDMTTLARTMLTRLVWMQGDPTMRCASPRKRSSARRGPSALALCVVLGAPPCRSHCATATTTSRPTISRRCARPRARTASTSGAITRNA